MKVASGVFAEVALNVEVKMRRQTEAMRSRDLSFVFIVIPPSLLFCLTEPVDLIIAEKRYTVKQKRCNLFFCNSEQTKAVPFVQFASKAHAPYS